MKFSLIIVLSRWFLFFLFLVSISIVYIWRLHPEHIDQVDLWASSRYSKHYFEISTSCNESLEKGDLEGAVCLDSLLSKTLASIEKEDNMAEVKRRLFVKIVKIYRQMGDYENASYWVNKWCLFNDRDLEAKVLKSYVNLDFPEKRKDGFLIISELYQKYPDVEIISNAYKNALRLNIQ